MADKKQSVDEILHKLFTNGAGEEADRLLLVKEPRSCSARVLDGQYLGGYSKEAVRRILDTTLATAKDEG